MKAVVLAYHEMGCAGIELLLSLGAKVLAVFTHRDDPDENLWFRPAAQVAGAAGLAVHAPENINDPEWVERIRALQPDMLFSFYYRKIVSPKILEIPPRGCFNLHGSLLPKFRGRSPTNWALVLGEEKTGVTLHEMVRKPDAGRIVAQREVRIGEEDDARSLFLKQVEAFRRMFVEVYPKLLDGTAPRLPQDESQATTFPGRRPEDGRISWAAPARAIHNLVRAVTRPYPGAFTWLGGRKCFIWKTRPAGGAAGSGCSAPGTITASTPQGVLVAAGDGLLELLRVQIPPEPDCVGPEIARLLSPAPGARFEEAGAP